MPLDPLIGQIIITPYNFPPNGYAFCAGQILPISQNTALFSILGTTYGGNGTSNFALPDLRSRIPVGAGQGPGLSDYFLGEQTGAETVTLLSPDMPVHAHAAAGTNNPANNPSPAGEGWAADGAGILTQYAATANAQMSSQAIVAAGSGGPHNNIMPVLGMNYCIALRGVFPTRN